MAAFVESIVVQIVNAATAKFSSGGMGLRDLDVVIQDTMFVTTQANFDEAHARLMAAGIMSS
jgi:hypothetical protein